MTQAVAPQAYADATVLFKGGHVAAARPLLEQCVAESPQHVGSRFGLAVCLDKHGDVAASERAYRTVIELDPAHLNGHLHLARLLARQARQQESREAFQVVLALAPGHAEATAALNGVPGQRDGIGATLAAELDDASGTPDAGAQMAGPVRYRGRRRLLSHRRLWGGILLLLLLPVTSTAQHRIAESSAVSSGQSLVVLLHRLQMAALAGAVALIAGAVASALLTRYVVRTRRIDIERGVLVRTRRSVWLYDVNDLEYTQTPVQLLAGSAQLTLHVDEPNEKRRSPSLVGFGPAAFLVQLSEELQPMVLRERRAMKKQFT
jgi:hypothetical protein